ncbi:hypothetical protein ACFSYG_16900 [Leeuwenhoekiella polynyae]|uniref:Uncharacterized protein n=1 Tax=Leeuwenhoekiella polynyae TaxID=1550906 RepID=A0A4Q0P1B1_9FLAO|nr:hypothetical protein [Leeuwenhoekiella polynyae]RXG20187.1 hypothetical protein DSM02_2623 [Leeuwenhoekiella polynyae]
MLFSGDNHFLKTLNTLLKRYKFSNQELESLQKVKKTEIISLAYTNDGGFDLKTGDYHDEDHPVNYKLRIYYKDPQKNSTKMLVLLPSTTEEFTPEMNAYQLGQSVKSRLL